jgi:hypothetical protein
MLIINDLREYIFALFLGEESSQATIHEKSLKFLGTAFFVSRKGDAITANHVLPEIAPGGRQKIFGAMVRDGATVFYKLVAAARFEASDFSLLRFDLKDCPFFELSFKEILIGTDVSAYGYGAHDLHGNGKELRLLKGHVTMPVALGIGELNFSVPGGMSGGPLMVGTKCIGFMIGNITSEQFLSSSEELTEVFNGVEKVTLVESKQVIHYGIFRPFSIYQGQKSELFSNMDLPEFISERNKPYPNNQIERDQRILTASTARA